MRLSDLLAPLAIDPALGALDVAGLSADSRTIGAGFVFFAVPGHAGDGLDYLSDARTRGARVVVAARIPENCDLPFVVVDDVRAALACAAARFHPRQPETICAVTGTSGKTSVVAFLRQIWRACGRAAASLGTVGVVDPSGAHYGALTTPGPVDLHRTLDELAGRGVTHLAMEASSIGIEQRRLDGVWLAAAGFTNFSRDHLDYHPTMEAYFAAKMRLFDTLLAPGATAVIDADGETAEKVAAICAVAGRKVFDVGAKGSGIALRAVEPGPDATVMTLRCVGTDYRVRLPLAGAFQVSNALVAAGLAIVCGEEPAQVFAALEGLEGAPGRLELIGARAGAPAFVDYAHKPDALEKVLATLRPLTKGRLIVVFGCGGDRDRGKRPLMGAIAARGADVVIVTDDNPRSEDPAAIRTAILEGARGAGGGAEIVEIADRQAAIDHAVAMLAAGDALVVAGKGHETGQIIGDRVLPFSDHAAIAQALGEIRS